MEFYNETYYQNCCSSLHWVQKRKQHLTEFQVNIWIEYQTWIQLYGLQSPSVDFISEYKTVHLQMFIFLYKERK